MQSAQITSVLIEGLHASQDLHISLRPGLNIIHGRNGSGKTTLLHTIANLAERDLERFCHIKFKRLVVKTLNGAEIEIHQKSFGEKGIVELWVDKQPVGIVRQGEETPPAVNLVLKERLGGRPVYLPAFRSILEAASRGFGPYVREDGREKILEKIIEREAVEARMEQKDRISRWGISSINERSRITAQKTILCREWFGAFVPLIRSPSLFDVADEVQNELQQAQLELAATDREALSEVFFQALQAALSDTEASEPSEDVQSLVNAVQQHFNRLQHSEIHGLDRETTLAYIRLRDLLQSKTEQAPSVEARVKRILKVYETALKNRTAAQERAFQRIKTFEQSVNKFLQGKKLVLAYEPRRRGRWETMGHSVVTLHDNRRHNFFVLSSGERHVLTLLFSATHMSPADGVVLIDEPELSLHVEWQRIIVTELMKQAGDRQIIACTHSPEVAAEHRDVLVSLKSTAVHSGKDHPAPAPSGLGVDQDEEA